MSSDDDDGPGFFSTLLTLGVLAGGAWWVWKQFSPGGGGLVLSEATTTATDPNGIVVGNLVSTVGDAVAPYLQQIANNATATAGYQAYGSTAATAAAVAGVPIDVFLSLITHESSWNPAAVGAAGDVGLAQVLPATAANPGYGVASFDPHNPVTNLFGAAQYLAALYRQTGNWRQALAAYNAGIGGQNSAAGQAYATAVLSNAGVAT